MIHPYLEEKRPQLINTCNQYGIKSLYAFGSVVRDDFSSSSDVDFLVEYSQEENDPIKRFEIFLELKERLEGILGRKVDIIQEKDLTNPYLKHFILQEKEKIYAQA